MGKRKTHISWASVLRCSRPSSSTLPRWICPWPDPHSTTRFTARVEVDGSVVLASTSHVYESPVQRGPRSIHARRPAYGFASPYSNRAAAAVRVGGRRFRPPNLKIFSICRSPIENKAQYLVVVVEFQGRTMPDAKKLFETLVREHADMLTVYLRAALGDVPEVDDLFQETMIVAWRRLDDFDQTRSFAAWLRESPATCSGRTTAASANTDSPP